MWVAWVCTDMFKHRPDVSPKPRWARNKHFVLAGHGGTCLKLQDLEGGGVSRQASAPGSVGACLGYMGLCFSKTKQNKTFLS